MYCTYAFYYSFVAAARIVVRSVDVSSMNVPTPEELNSGAGAETSKLVMQFGAKIRDSKAHFKQIQHEAVGVKRDFEYEDNVSRPDASPIYGSLFRTMAPPYTSVPYIHNLFRKNVGPTVSDVKHRKRNALIHPSYIEWVISFLAELDITYFRKIRYNSEYSLFSAHKFRLI